VARSSKLFAYLVAKRGLFIINVQICPFANVQNGAG
jgi:hypothetical protein